jgi:hypothetical protein
MAIKTWPAEVNSVRTATVLSPDEVQLPEEIFIVPGAHLDFGWCAGISECLAYADELIKGAIDTITGPEPDYRLRSSTPRFCATSWRASRSTCPR